MAEKAVGLVAIIAVAVMTLPLWGMGPATFLDSDRMILSSAASPDGTRIAQVERLTVGGVPRIVVTVRARWKPNWYLASCAAASHYEEVAAKVGWSSNRAIRISAAEPERWELKSAPFRHGGCPDLAVQINGADAVGDSPRIRDYDLVCAT